MAISTDMIVRVAHADIAMRMAFPNSIAHWHGAPAESRRWKFLAGDCGPLLLGNDDAVVIDGDCSSPVSAPSGGIIHVYGDLSSSIDAAGHNEIIVAGNVGRDASIDASGFCHLFVGGGFAGEVRTSGSAMIWIERDFDGTAKTGNPSTEFYIGRNFHGK
jgi:hypothetical protein